jgi:acetyltransferase-like isoleucine patch superfamily enzyme
MAGTMDQIIPPDYARGRILEWAKRVGLEDSLHDVAKLRANAGLIAANFFFQRIVGINRDVSWPVNFTSRVTNPKKIHIHPSVRASFALSGGCYVQGGSGIEIGEGTLFAPGVKIISANHSAMDLSKLERVTPIVIGRRCWIGANAVILPGTMLGDGVIVGAGSVVKGEFPDGVVLGGVPARVLKSTRAE